jgi:hypothetical protein
VGFGQAPDSCAAGGALDGVNCALSPVEVGGLTDVVSVEAGGTHSCALDASGDVWCWGWLGRAGWQGVDYDDYEYAGMQGTPKRLPAIGPAVAIATNHFSTTEPGGICAIVRGGEVQCWGGDGASGAHGPAKVEPLHDSERAPSFALAEPALQVATASDHSCALAEGGAVYCWGRNDFGQLGFPPDAGCGGAEAALGAAFCEATDDGRRVLEPLRVEGLEPAVQVGIHGRLWNAEQSAELPSCALLEDRTLTCWGASGMERVEAAQDVTAFAGDCLGYADGRVRCGAYGMGGEPVFAEVEGVRL